MDLNKISWPLGILVGTAVIASVLVGASYINNNGAVAGNPNGMEIGGVNVGGAGGRKVYIWGIMPVSSRFPTTYGSPNSVGRVRSPLLKACARSMRQNYGADEIVLVTEHNVLELVSPEMRRLVARQVHTLGNPSSEALRDAILLDIIAHRGGIVAPLATVFMEKPVELEKSVHSGVLALVDTDMRAVAMIKPVNEGGGDDSAPVMSFDPAMSTEERVSSQKRAALKLAHSLPDSYLQLGGIRTQLKRNNVALNVFPSSQIGLRDANGIYVSMERLVRGGNSVRFSGGDLRPRMLRLAPELSRMLRREDQWVQKASVSQIVESGSSLGMILEELGLDDDVHPDDFPLHLGSAIEVEGVESRRKDPLLVVQDD